MTTELEQFTPDDVVSAPAALDVGRIDRSLADARSASTRRNYDRQWSRFVDYCQRRNLPWLPAPADVVCDYLLSMENTLTLGPDDDTVTHTYSVSAIDGALAAIKYAHRAAPVLEVGRGSEPPVWAHPRIADTMRAIRNRYAGERRRPVQQRAPLSLADLTAMINTARSHAFSWRSRLFERRDTAVLVIGWAAAARRSEIMALQVGDIHQSKDRWIINIATSKTDQAGAGHLKALPTGQHLATCGPCAYLRWAQCLSAFDQSGRSGLIRLLATPDRHTRHLCADPGELEIAASTPLFRGITRSGHLADKAPGGQLVHAIVRRRLAAARPEVDVSAYGAHSLRAGFVTEAFEQGHTPRNVMRQTGHKHMDSVLRYGREKDVYTNNAATDLGL